MRIESLAVSPSPATKDKIKLNNCFTSVEHVAIDGEKKVTYSFKNSTLAEDFIKQLNSIFQKEVSCFQSGGLKIKDYAPTIELSLTPQEFDYLWGESSLARILSARAQILFESRLPKGNHPKSLASSIFKSMNPYLMRQFFLLVESEDFYSLNRKLMLNTLIEMTLEGKIKIADGMWLLKQANDHFCNRIFMLNADKQFPFFIDFFNRLNIERSIHLFFWFENLYSSLNDVHLKVKYLSTIIERHDITQKFANKYPQLSCIRLYDRGESLHNWPKIAESLILDAPSCNPYNQYKKYPVLDAIKNTKTKPLSEIKNFSNFINQLKWTFLRVQGRTILFENNDRIFAVKIKKQSESQDELEKEYNTLHYFKNNKKTLQLQSDLPTPAGVGKVNGVLDGIKPYLTQEALASLVIMVGDALSHSAYFYQVDRSCDYFTYLHDPHLSDEAFKAGNEKAVSDLFHLLSRGMVFPQLTDLFHNTEHKRTDGGRYLVLVDLLRSLRLKGSGRLNHWKQAIAYPNLRGSGLADLGDHISAEEFTYQSPIVNKYYLDTWELRSVKTGNFLLANTMAEYQYVLFLIAGLRGCQFTESANSKENAKEIWRTLALQVVRNCALAISIVTSQSQFTAYHFLSSIINVDRLAKQMQYWMTDAYIADVSQNKIDKEIYGEDVHVVINKEGFRKGTFNDHVGFSIDGKHADLGPVNGQEPLKEANKLFYWMVIMIFQSYQETQLTRQNLKAIANKKDIFKAEEMRKHAFTHLTTKSYHAIQLQLCKKLLEKPDLPEEIREEVRKETEDHRRNWAAATIGIFWHQRKNHQPKLAAQDNAIEVKEKCRPI